MASSSFLAGRTCVITGAASGIGRATAERLSGMGCPLALCDWDEAGLEETANGLSTEVITRKLDVSDNTAQMVFAAEVKDWAPKPFGMVMNNAGVTVSQLAAEAATEDDEWVMNINFWGVVFGTRAWLPILLEQGDGVIANTSSIFGLMGWPAQSMYCASKHAVRGYTESLRHELRDTKVRAVAIHPGGIKTNIVKNARFHKDDLGNTDRSVLEKDFDLIARTSPHGAAKKIVTSVDKGRARVLIGPDADMVSALTRIMPIRYFDVIKKLEFTMRKK